MHKFVPMPQAMKIPDAKAAGDKEWEKVDKLPARAKKEVILEAQRENKKVHFATLMDICHLESAELKKKKTTSEMQWPGCTPR